MKKNKNIVFLTGDLGFNALEPIAKEFPERFINVGIAEANMIGLAAGLALTGQKVIVYSIAPFVTLRVAEQIRDDICYHNLDVKIIGVGGGFNYASHGLTHHAVEDFAILSSMPNMTVLNPAYGKEATEITKSALRHTGPVYIRLGKNPEVEIPEPKSEFKIGKGYVVKEGTRIVFISTGNILEIVLETAEQIEKKLSRQVGVINMPSIKPLDKNLFRKISNKAEAIFTAEEHNVIGGLGSMVAAEMVKVNKKMPIFWSFGVQDFFIKDVGDRAYLLQRAGLDCGHLVKTALRKLRR